MPLLFVATKPIANVISEIKIKEMLEDVIIIFYSHLPRLAIIGKFLAFLEDM